MALRQIPGPEAWASVSQSSSQQWDQIASRFAEQFFNVALKPKFKLAAEDRFFCIGSCFARNVEEHLLYRRIEVLSKRIVSPRSEWNARPNGIVNKFTTQSMLQEIEWLFDSKLTYKEALVETPQGWRDMQLCPGLGPAPLERAVERRRYLLEDYFPRLRSADVVIITLGLNEVWLDRKSGIYLNATPSVFSTRKDPERYVLEVTDAAQNTACLERIFQRLKLLNPNVRVVISVSPVPMSVTFSGEDIAVANMGSKSTLRAAAGAFAARHDDVDYFPSYEMVSLTARATAYGEDCLHVSDAVVRQVMHAFLDEYIGSTAEPYEGFTEFGYFEANPDVEDAVRRGEYASGFEHWLEHGLSEGRRIGPDEPTERMIRAGL
jgi:hypothetical protein